MIRRLLWLLGVPILAMAQPVLPPTLVMTTGAGAPSANCTAPSSRNLAAYNDTTNNDLWFCYATNAWKKFLSVTGSGQYIATGAEGTAPSNPASGSVSCYFSSTSHTQICLDSSGNAFTSVKAATCSGTDRVSAISAAGVVTCSATSGGSNVTRTPVWFTSANGAQRGPGVVVGSSNATVSIDAEQGASLGQAGLGFAHSTDNYVYVPFYFDAGLTDLTIILRTYGATVSAGNAILSVATSCGTALSTATWNTASTPTVAYSASNTAVDVTISAVNTNSGTDCAGKMGYLRFGRVGSSGSDTSTSTFYFVMASVAVTQ